MTTIVVTGATGFIGGHLLPLLAQRGHTVVAAGRRRASGASRFEEIGDIGPSTDWTAALRGAHAVIHLAGLAHGKARGATDFATVNAEGTRRLVEAARTAKTSVVVNVSSIAAREAGNGPSRLSAYAASKLEAEGHVAAFAEESGSVGISLRPPLVYGWDAPANWRALQKLAASGLPLPFGAVHNRRTFCAVDNLCDAIVLATERGLQGDGSGIYEVADSEIMSLRDVIASLRRGMGMTPRLVPVPPALLRLGGRLAGRGELVETLIGDLVLTPHRFMRRFGWSVKVRAHEAMAASGRRFVRREA